MVHEVNLEPHRVRVAEGTGQRLAQRERALQVEQKRSTHVVVVVITLFAVTRQRRDQSSASLTAVACAFEDGERAWSVAHEMLQPVHDLGPALPEIRNVVDVAKSNTRLIEAEPDRFGGKSAEVLLPVE